MSFLYLLLLICPHYFFAAFQSLTLENTSFLSQHYFEPLLSNHNSGKRYDWNPTNKKVKYFDFIQYDSANWEGVVEYCDDDLLDNEVDNSRIEFFKGYRDPDGESNFILDCECASDNQCNYCYQFQSKLRDGLFYCGNGMAVKISMFNRIREPLLLYCDPSSSECKKEKLWLKGAAFKPKRSTSILVDDSTVIFKNNEEEEVVTYDRKTQSVKVQIGSSEVPLVNGLFYCGERMFLSKDANGDLFLLNYSDITDIKKELLFQGLKADITHAFTEGDHNIKFYVGSKTFVYNYVQKTKAYTNGFTDCHPLSKLHFELYPWQEKEGTHFLTERVIKNGNVVWNEEEYPLRSSLFKRTIVQSVIAFRKQNIFLRLQDSDRIILFDVNETNFYTFEKEPKFDEMNLSWMDDQDQPIKSLIPQSKIYLCWLKLKLFLWQSKKLFKNYIIRALIEIIKILPQTKVQKALFTGIIESLIVESLIE